METFEKWDNQFLKTFIYIGWKILQNLSTKTSFQD